MDLMDKQFWNNDFITDNGKRFMSYLWDLINVQEVYMGNVYAYSCEVLVIVATAKGELNLKMSYQDDFKVNEAELFLIEVCLDKEDGFAIQISNDEYEPVGFIDLEKY